MSQAYYNRLKSAYRDALDTLKTGDVARESLKRLNRGD